ncbi:hypothetical protein N7492_001691 [Penicillium capsulatum]|uniref:Uncharacterized protein n=1 Tax=Penicillium capsulatum TaxID=69766 RepID=A0A9W9M033_9EURO|nr:hypothetical protein N7492_001691 [Penicillium capsulatum]KAJ6129257.1 hypothetical protein N7512_002037 [Penicillium capsulatum]
MAANGGKAYVHDPEHGNQAIIGETWHYAELPALMRNVNIKSIYSFYLTEDGKAWKTHKEWDIERDGQTYPTNAFPDLQLDSATITDVPGRDPFKK